MSDDRHKRIEQRAYEIWEREGRPMGMDAENWRRAEEEIAREDAEARAPQAEAEAEAEAEPEPAAAPEDGVKAKPGRATRSKAQAKPAEAEAPSSALKAEKKDEETDASAGEVQQKGTRKRKAGPKKK